MVHQCLPPGVQHGDEAYVSTDASGAIVCEGLCGW